jgi:hypothetical protein
VTSRSFRAITPDRTQRGHTAEMAPTTHDSRSTPGDVTMTAAPTKPDPNRH